ncbi:TonB dependent receptor [Epilithonimonas bovis DSM 19482]|uniref:TonB dependent receptor n=1 Tax=Epilithonimonas bovis DSM 19482 TaxID=1121284 RepID=A0A1U7PUH2_9FLAO|nr:TonB-dependent receptor [Epilithonimonas bovis]SIT95592.1 TonB dependent receptor [Epilithonimonas bovis DSM 19482]
MNKLKYIAVLAFLSTVGISEVGAQIKEEQLILAKKREPEVKKIEKKKTSVVQEKNYPPDNKKKEDSLNLKYDIVNVPPVSDFKTTEIQSEDISPKFSSDYQSNYFRLGYGNYGKFLADANISGKIQDNVEIGADAHYLSTSGLKKDYDWDSKQNEAKIGVFSNIYTETGKFNIDANYAFNNYNYYGIYALTPQTNDLDLTQKVNKFSVNGYYDHYSNDILNNVRVKSYFLSDHFGASENYANAEVNLSKHDFSVYDDITANGDLGINLETVNSKFNILNKSTNNQFNFTLSPKVTFYKGDSYFLIGSDFSFLNSKNTSIGGDSKNNKFYWFPRAEVLVAAADEFKFYGGIDGGLKLNTYGNLLDENPYLISDLYLAPTETKYHFYFGMKGDVDQAFKYDFNAGFSKVNQAQFFMANNLFDFNLNSNRNGYDYANTFNSVYDNGTLMEVKGDLQAFPVENLVVDAGLHFMKYKLDNLDQVYYKPLFRFNIGAKYTMLEKKLNLGFKTYFVTDRTTNSFAVSAVNPIIPTDYYTEESRNQKVGGYVDLNLSAEYKIHKNFSIFALGNNLLNTKYQNYLGYKVLGAQVVGGVKITF